MHKNVFKKAGAIALTSVFTAAMVAPGVALAADTDNAADASASTNAAFWKAPSAAATIDSDLLTTYGVRAGSAGPDFVGVTNTNFDFTDSAASAAGQFDYSGIDFDSTKAAGLALWATSVNEEANPYYANLYYNALTNGTATAATTWSANPGTSSWGDSNGAASTIAGTERSTINGLEYQPDIIFGANKYTNWDNFDYSSTVIGKAVTENTTGYGANYNPAFVNNDSTNLWTQVYTINQLAQEADQLSVNGKKTRYNNSSSITSALAYEKSLRGNLLYIASQIDQGKANKKTVAYLYAIDENGTGYFFIPQASNLTNGTDTGADSSSAQATADTNYAANNATIDLDYMDTLPFITNTFSKGTAVDGGVVMKVEDIWKSSPAVSVGSSQTTALKGVDAIIYNTTTLTNLQGNNGGKNQSGINNNYKGTALNTEKVQQWASDHGFTGDQIIAGDDWGTSSNQGYGTTATTEAGMSPLLYCQRNYTTDKPARAAWAYSQLYPELYPNADASYSYWVKNVYHINMSDVPTVVKYFTNQSDTVNYSLATQNQMEDRFQTGLDWWVNTGSKESKWNQYAYYNGSSRGSYYDAKTPSEEPENTIGIFQPTAEWAAKANKVTPAAKKTQTLKVSQNKKTIKAKTVKSKNQTAKITVKGAKGAVTYAKAKTTGNYKKVAISKKSKTGATLTFKKGTKAGTYKFTVKAKATSSYKASKTYTVTVKVK